MVYLFVQLSENPKERVMAKQWYKVTIRDEDGKDYARFTPAESFVEAAKRAEEELTRGVGLMVHSVEHEPAGARAVFRHPVPPPYPGQAEIEAAETKTKEGASAKSE